MSVVTVLGDATTTTVLALAAGWPDEVLVVEADPRGGSMAAWLDLPATPTLSAAVTRAGERGWPAIDAVTHASASGLRVVTAPTRALEAAQAAVESTRHVMPILAAIDHPVALVDAGRVDAHSPVGGVPARSAVAPGTDVADVVMVVHRQRRHSARAAAVRIERLADLVDALVSTSPALPVVLGAIGDVPFESSEIAEFVQRAQPLAGVIELAEDRLSAAVLAGRSGVSARRLARLPLMRTARRAASLLDTMVVAAREGRRSGGDETLDRPAGVGT